MPVYRNVSNLIPGSRRTEDISRLPFRVPSETKGIVERIPGLDMFKPPAETPGVSAPETPKPPASLPPAAFEFRPELINRIRELPPFFPKFEISRTTTQLAQHALQQLSNANAEVLRETITTIRNKNIAGPNLMNYLERRVIIGEVLNEIATRWTDETKQDFSEAFNMKIEKLDVMDAIVSIAILNDKELEGELRIENSPQPTEGDLLEGRKIIWQYPPPGTVLQPPYVVVVAVEHQDTAKSQEVVQSILGSLVDFQGYKIPRAAAQKL